VDEFCTVGTGRQFKTIIPTPNWRLCFIFIVFVFSHREEKQEK